MKTKKQTEKVAIKNRKYERLFNNQFHLKYTNEKIDQIADDLCRWYNESEKHIFLKQFAVKNFILANRFSEFCKKSEYFKFIHSYVMQIQEIRLIQLGLDKTVNVALPILCLKNNHGYKSEPNAEPLEDVEIVVKLPGSMTEDELNEAVKRRLGLN